MKHLNTFRKNVRETMAERGISLRAMAPDLGTSHTYLHRILNGQQSPSFERCEEIARYLKIPLPDLIQKNKQPA